ARSLSGRSGADDVATGWRLLAYAMVPLVLLQIFLGGLVAGLDAGLSHNTWPLMDGYLVPPAGDLYVMRPAWVNHFENAMTAQSHPRMVSFLICVLPPLQAVGLWQCGPGRAARRAVAIAGLTLAQAVIGIITLLLVVPLGAALAHQAAAVALLA